MSNMMMQVVVANHDDNEFYWLGKPFTHEVPAEKFLASLPTEPPHVCDEHNMCIMLDLVDDRGDVCDDREITREQANTLLDGRFDELYAAAREELADVYEIICEAPERAAELREKAG
jgi:hypothetical protein